MAQVERFNRSAARRTRPSAEGLESRQLLASHLVTPAIAPTKFVSYTTPSGGLATIRLQGPGTISGSLDANGALKLVYDNTSPNSLIIGKIRGGNRTAPLLSIDDADVSPTDYSGVNGNLVNTVRLGNFDLVSGGAINLTAGVAKLYLHSAAPNSQIHLRDIPNAVPMSTSIQLNSLTSPTYTPGGGPAFESNTVAIDGPIGPGQAPVIGTNNNNTPFTVPNSFNSQGRTLTYSTDNTGAVFLRGTGTGVFTPGTNVIGSLPNGAAGPPWGIPGVLVNIGIIQGIDPIQSPVLIDVQGNLQALKAGSVSGLYLNGEGNVGLVQITDAADSLLYGYPFGHLKLSPARRTNVIIATPSRVVGDRGEVIVDPNLAPQGVLSLPLTPP